MNRRKGIPLNTSAEKSLQEIKKKTTVVFIEYFNSFTYGRTV